MKNYIQEILNILKEKEKLKVELAEWFETVKRYSQDIPNEVAQQVRLLAEIRRNLYEDLNQLQHVALLLEAADELQAKYQHITSWTWHPRQTSHPDFTDLTGYMNGQPCLHAEATASAAPKGVIDRRMSNTLANLARRQGRKLYFVRTPVMEQRAKNKSVKSGYDIEIRLLKGQA